MRYLILIIAIIFKLLGDMSRSYSAFGGEDLILIAGVVAFVMMNKKGREKCK